MFLASGTSVYYGSDRALISYNPVFSSSFCKSLFHPIVAHTQVSITNDKNSEGVLPGLQNRMLGCKGKVSILQPAPTSPYAVVIEE